MMKKNQVLEKIFMPLSKHYNILLIALVFGVLTACGGKQEMTVTAVEPSMSAQEQLNNQLMLATLWVQQSAEARYAYQQAYKRAEHLLMANVKKYKPKRGLTVIVDVDETILDNSPYQASLIGSDQGFTYQSWNEWVMQGAAKPMPGALRFIQLCEGMGIEVFYISNRDVEMVDATVENLIRYEFPYADREHMLFKVETSDKTQRREEVKQGRTIILSVGDQLTDFMDEEMERMMVDAGEEKLPFSDSIYNHFVLLPNPMYGSFESRLYSNGRQTTAEQKLVLRNKALIKP